MNTRRANRNIEKRNAQLIYDLRTHGKLTFDRIGTKLGITRQAAHQNYKRTLAKLKAKETQSQ